MLKGMELDFLGAEQNLSVLAGAQPDYNIRFFNDDGKATDLSDVTFDGLVSFPDGHTEEMDITQDDDTSMLHVVFPLLTEVNSYTWEIRSVSVAGERLRIAHGKIGVLPTDLDLTPDEIEQTETKTLSAYLPGKAQAHVMMVWKATTTAAMAAERAVTAAMDALQHANDAEASAKRAEEAEKRLESSLDEAVKEATAEAKGYRDEAKEAADNVHKAIEDAVEGVVDEATAEAKGYAEAAKQSAEEAAESAGEAQGAVDEVKGSAQELANAATKDIRDQVTELVEDVRATRQETEATVRRLELFLVEFEDNVRSVVWVDPETEHLFIGGVDTMVKITGEDGKSPYVDSEGHWRYWDDESQQWLDGGPARGEDGFAPYINSEGYMVYRDPLTGEVRTSTQRVYGVDGRPGEAVRRIIVQSYEEIPQDGETCNGGVYYYVAQQDAPPVAIFTPEAERRESGSMFVNGKSVALPPASMGQTEAARQLVLSLREVFPEAVVEYDPETDSAILIGDVPYWQVRGLPADEWTLTQHVRMHRDGYDVYAWLEQPDGTASWVRIGEANDIATAEVYGLTKLGTDITIEKGAPVGTDEHGQMRVPVAQTTVQGTVQLSVEGSLEDGVGGIGVDDQGRIWARRASRDTYGVVKPSYTGNLESAPVIGMDDEGRMQIPFATLGQAGVIRLGSMYGQANPIPFRVGVGADEEHHLANNLVYGGAIQHMQPSGWAARNMKWLEKIMAEHKEYFVDMYYQGLVTSDQFTQDASDGLILNSATKSMVGGVMIASSMQDRSDDTVPTAKMIVSWMNENFYTKTEIDEKERGINAAISQNYDTLNDRITSETQSLGSRIETEVKNLNTTINNKEKALSDRIDSEVRNLNTTINNKEKALSDRIDSEVRTLNSTINNKEKALSDRITANANKFASYSTTSQMQNYVSGQLKSYPSTTTLNNSLKNYYTKSESDNRFVRGEDGFMRLGLYDDDSTIVALSTKNPDKLYVKVQKKI